MLQCPPAPTTWPHHCNGRQASVLPVRNAAFLNKVMVKLLNLGLGLGLVLVLQLGVSVAVMG